MNSCAGTSTEDRVPKGFPLGTTLHVVPERWLGTSISGPPFGNDTPPVR
jgi:hypothetical protein